MEDELKILKLKLKEGVIWFESIKSSVSNIIGRYFYYKMNIDRVSFNLVNISVAAKRTYSSSVLSIIGKHSEFVSQIN